MEESEWCDLAHCDYVDELRNNMDDFDFFESGADKALHISKKEEKIIESIVNNIQAELDFHLDDFNEDVIVTKLEFTFDCSKRFYRQKFTIRKQSNTRVVSKFESLLMNYFNRELQKKQGIPTIKYFAHELCYSPNYLSGIIKRETHKTVLEHVHDRVIEIAKKELRNSDKQVSEIAFDLGFEYSQYFSRLFKKKTGMTPREYRIST